MTPDLELVHIRKGESFAAWSHGYPFRTVRWHYHPEYEIHMIAATSGKFFIGDRTGTFQPGQLVMTGPNLPQNWISDVPAGKSVPRRSLIVQFPEEFIENSMVATPELEAIRPLLQLSHRGLLFDDATSKAVRAQMEQLPLARGIRRLALFWDILDILAQAPQPEVLASLNYAATHAQARSNAMNHAIAYLREHLTDPVTELELAHLTGQNPAAFSRAFRRHTGIPLVRYRNQLRIDLACQMLLIDLDTKISSICHDVGFSNLSNFNRHFLKLKGMSPSEYRAKFAENQEFVEAA